MGASLQACCDGDPAPPPSRKVFIIGATGAIGTSLAGSIVRSRGPHSVVAALHRTPLPPGLDSVCLSEFGVDVRNKVTLKAALARHADDLEVVWNLAAPLSVETAGDPEKARQVTVLGMQNVLDSLIELGLQHQVRVCFTDSIGSFGATAPRQGATARWLTEHPLQDPGSAYGRQKRECRELLARASADYGLDTRWAVVPGVLHPDEAWGRGTTEYALDALAVAAAHSKGGDYGLAIREHATLPMIARSDLTRGLIALMDAPRPMLREPDAGYAIAGFSFAPSQLFAEIRSQRPNFSYYDAGADADPVARHCAETWPDTLDPAPAARDLGFMAERGLSQTVSCILLEHAKRRRNRAKQQRPHHQQTAALGAGLAAGGGGGGHGNGSDNKRTVSFADSTAAKASPSAARAAAKRGELTAEYLALHAQAAHESNTFSDEEPDSSSGFSENSVGRSRNDSTN